MKRHGDGPVVRAGGKTRLRALAGSVLDTGLNPSGLGTLVLSSAAVAFTSQ